MVAVSNANFKIDTLAAFTTPIIENLITLLQVLQIVLPVVVSDAQGVHRSMVSSPNFISQKVNNAVIFVSLLSY